MTKEEKQMEIEFENHEEMKQKVREEQKNRLISYQEKINTGNVKAKEKEEN
jgi:hypothetical protein